MALLRLIHASTLPDPGELARMIANGAPMGGAAPAAPAARASAQPVEANLPNSVARSGRLSRRTRASMRWR